MIAALDPLQGLAFVLGAGTFAQWLAWRLRLPAILLLLLLGFVAGPITGLFDPSAVFGELLRPLVSLAVGLILFEGGLSLRFSDLRGSGAVVRNLVSVGALVTWLLTTAAAVWLTGASMHIALLVGALLTLTGPTVVIPLLRHVAPQGPTAAILRWEGILIDPLGAMLAIVVFEAIRGGGHGTPGTIALDVVRMVVAGSLIGFAAARLLAEALERFLIPDALHVPVTLGTVAVVFVGADMLQEEAGLFAVTVAGMTLANRKALDVEHIVEWKEHLSTVLLSVLFLSIAAHLPLAPLTELGLRAVVFALALVVVVRPVAVLLSTVGTRLPRRDRLFLMAMAPRGIVVAAVSSQLALDLERSGDGGGDTVLALVFPAIVLTVTVYGLFARPFARWIGIAKGTPQGALIVGADLVGREIGKALQEQGFEVLLVDTNAKSAANARTSGLPTFHGSVLSTRFFERADFHGLGNLLALLPSDEINRLAAQELVGTFGRKNLFRTAPIGKAAGDHRSAELGRILFGAEITVDVLRERLRHGARIKATKLTEQFGAEQFAAHHGGAALPLFVVTPDRRLEVVTADAAPALADGCTVLSLVPPATDAEGPPVPATMAQA